MSCDAHWVYDWFIKNKADNTPLYIKAINLNEVQNCEEKYKKQGERDFNNFF